MPRVNKYIQKMIGWTVKLGDTVAAGLFAGCPDLQKLATCPSSRKP
jgi:hypothetical protein